MQKWLFSVTLLLLLVPIARSQTIDAKTIPFWEDYVPGKSSADVLYVVASTDYSGYLLKPSTVKRRGDIAGFSLELFEVGDGIIVSSGKVELNCKASSYRTISTTNHYQFKLYEDGMIEIGEKGEYSFESPNEPWKPVVAETMISEVQRAVCALK